MFTAQDRFVIACNAVARQKAKDLDSNPRDIAGKMLSRERVRMVIGCIETTISTDLPCLTASKD